MVHWITLNYTIHAGIMLVRVRGIIPKMAATTYLSSWGIRILCPDVQLSNARNSVDGWDDFSGHLKIHLLSISWAFPAGKYLVAHWFMGWQWGSGEWHLLIPFTRIKATPSQRSLPTIRSIIMISIRAYSTTFIKRCFCIIVLCYTVLYYFLLYYILYCWVVTLGGLLESASCLLEYPMAQARQALQCHRPLQKLYHQERPKRYHKNRWFDEAKSRFFRLPPLSMICSKKYALQALS